MISVNHQSPPKLDPPYPTCSCTFVEANNPKTTNNCWTEYNVGRRRSCRRRRRRVACGVCVCVACGMWRIILKRRSRVLLSPCTSVKLERFLQGSEQAFPLPACAQAQVPVGIAWISWRGRAKMCWAGQISSLRGSHCVIKNRSPRSNLLYKGKCLLKRIINGNLFQNKIVDRKLMNSFNIIISYNNP